MKQNSGQYESGSWHKLFESTGQHSSSSTTYTANKLSKNEGLREWYPRQTIPHKQSLASPVQPKKWAVYRIKSRGRRAEPNSRATWGVSLQPRDCWDRGFEFRWRHRFPSLVFVVRFTGSGLRSEPITLSAKPYRVCVCVCVCARVCVCVSNGVWYRNFNRGCLISMWSIAREKKISTGKYFKIRLGNRITRRRLSWFAVFQTIHTYCFDERHGGAILNYSLVSTRISPFTYRCTH